MNFRDFIKTNLIIIAGSNFSLLGSDNRKMCDISEFFTGSGWVTGLNSGISGGYKPKLDVYYSGEQILVEWKNNSFNSGLLLENSYNLLNWNTIFGIIPTGEYFRYFTPNSGNQFFRLTK